MGLLSRLLGRQEATKPAPATPAEGAQPARHAAAAAYDPALLARLKDEHRELQRTLSAAQRAGAECRFTDVAHLLAHFRHTFQAHIATENARFYPYLQQHVALDAAAASLLAEVRREMNDLAFEVLKVVDAYIAYPPTHLTEVQFKYDLQLAGAQLARRVEKVEARLYSLYRP